MVRSLQLTNRQGRTLAVPSAGKHTDIARFTFHDLCVASRGTADYTALAATFHTIFVENVPKLDLHNRNEVSKLGIRVSAMAEMTKHATCYCSCDGL